LGSNRSDFAQKRSDSARKFQGGHLKEKITFESKFLKAKIIFERKKTPALEENAEQTGHCFGPLAATAVKSCVKV